MKKLLYLFLFLSFTSFIYSQTWTLNTNTVQRVYAFAIDPSNNNIMYSAGLDSGVYKTTNAGASWIKMINGMTYFKVQALGISPSNPQILYAGTDHNGGTNSGVYKTTNGGTSWAAFNTGIQEPSRGVQAIVVHPSNPNIAWMALFDGVAQSTVGLYKTTDGGANWNVSNTGIGSIKNILSIAINPLNPNVLYCGTSFNSGATTEPVKIYKSLNGGTTWIDVSTGLPPGGSNDPVRALTVASPDTSFVLAALFCNDSLGGAYITTNGGTNWVKRWPSAMSTVGTLLRSCTIRPSTNDELYVGLDRSTVTTDLSVWRSTNKGVNWTQFVSGALANNQAIRSLAFKNVGGVATLYAGSASATGNGVYQYVFPEVPVEFTSFTAAAGNNSVMLNWSTATETNNKEFEVQRNDGSGWNNIAFIPGKGTTTERHYYSYSDLLSKNGHYSYRIRQVDYDGSWSYSEVVTVSFVLKAGQYTLGQNYPNPFNPSTVINFSIPKSEFVSLKVYNVIGTEVCQLINEQKEKGDYQVNFTPSDLPTGVYFYTLNAGNFTSTKKLLFIK